MNEHEPEIHMLRLVTLEADNNRKSPIYLSAGH